MIGIQLLIWALIAFVIYAVWMRSRGRPVKFSLPPVPKLPGFLRRKRGATSAKGSTTTQVDERLNLIDQSQQQTRREIEKLIEKVANLENAARQRFNESDGMMLCPSCEAKSVVKGDYLCEDCRYG